MRSFWVVLLLVVGQVDFASKRWRPSSAEVREALRNLTNVVALAQCELARLLPQLQGAESLQERGRRLRALLLEGIEALGPTRPAPFGSLQSRAVDVLTLHYIEQMTVPEIAAELSLSRRQVQRDLRKAERLLAELLAGAQAEASGASAAPIGGHSCGDMAEEVARLARSPGVVSLATLMKEALDVVAPLAEARSVRVSVHATEEELPPVVADCAFLGQLLVQALSLAIQFCSSGLVQLRAQVADRAVVVQVDFGVVETPELKRRLEELAALADAGGIECGTSVAARRATLGLRLRTSVAARILVVEDNPGAVELYRRYCTGTGFEVVAVPDARLVWDMVRVNHPDVVVLDIMMPHVDGWRVLYRLKQSPETQKTPVIVCSVIDDPALAEALGAEAYLRKPVCQSEFMGALKRCLGAALGL